MSQIKICRLVYLLWAVYPRFQRRMNTCNKVDAKLIPIKKMFAVLCKLAENKGKYEDNHKIFLLYFFFSFSNDHIFYEDDKIVSVCV